MELNLKGKHIFSLIKLINKMNIKKKLKSFSKGRLRMIEEKII